MMLIDAIKPGDRHRYTITKPRGSHPAGTECYVSRPEGLAFLRLEFDDGSTIDLPKVYAMGIEDTLPDELMLAY